MKIVIENDVQLEAFYTRKLRLGVKKWVLKAIKEHDEEQMRNFRDVLMHALMLCNISHQIKILETCLMDIMNDTLKKEYDIQSRNGFALKLCIEVLEDDFSPSVV